MKLKMKSRAFLKIFISLFSASVALAVQPTLTVPVVNYPCQDGPKMVGGKPDTVVSVPDSEGFYSLFNGTDLTGWWEDCQTHTTDTKLGGIWIVDPTQHLLYSREEGQNGDILVTNKIFDNYELILDVWPTFGDDGGVFNRVTASGSCFQSTIDYITGSSVGGSYNEKNWYKDNINDDPYLFQGSPNNPSIPDDFWTNQTKVLNPTSFGCSALGCVSTDFVKIWDVDGWNQFRVKFYDGLAPGRSVHMKNYFRKLGVPNWVPAYDKSIAQVTPPGPIGLQIHGSGRWKAGAYNIYRNIKIRPLDINGDPLIKTTSLKTNENKLASPNLKIVNGVLSGKLSESYSITISNARGQVFEKFNSSEGKFSHGLSSPCTGLLFLELKNNRGTYHIRLNRI